MENLALLLGLTNTAILVLARTFLAASLNWLDVDIEQWNEVQLEAVVLNVIFPNAVVPNTAVIDFLVAISVLPMATFTTLSVLGAQMICLSG